MLYRGDISVIGEMSLFVHFLIKCYNKCICLFGYQSFWNDPRGKEK